MTAVREAITLPLLFLSVTLTGGLLSGAAALRVPSLFALVLAMLLCAALVQSGTLAPERLVRDDRGLLANLNGLVVFATLFSASAQVFTLVTPESGLPAVIVAAWLFVALLHTLAVWPDRIRLLRGLTIWLGAAFIAKFIMLAALSAPGEGVLTRALQTLFDGVTLGSVTQQPMHPAAGYLAFATLVGYLAGLVLLPGAGWRMTRIETRTRTVLESN